MVSEQVSAEMEAKKFVIVFVIDGLGLGGAERLMIPVLKNINRNIFEPRVCVLQTRDGNPMADDLHAMGIPVDLIPVRYLRDISAIPRLAKYLRRVSADLVHTQLEFSDVLGNFSAKLLGLPSVSTIHTMPSQDMDAKSKMHQNLEMFSLRYFCDTVISVSEEARQFHLKISNALPHKIQTIYNGIDLSNFMAINRNTEFVAVRNEFSIPNDAKVLMTVAVLRELKGIQFMIRALPEILSKQPDAYYLIVGSGAHRDALEQEVKKLDVTNRVIFSGKRSDIPRLLAATDIFVLPTLTEALPTVLAEAMAAHLPMVACAVGGIPEMIENGKNGILIPPADPQALANACIQLLTDPERCKSMGDAGWEVVNKKFNIKTQVEKLEKLYLNLIRAYEK